MHPRIITLPIGGGIPIHSYGVMLGISFIVAWFLTGRLGTKDGIPEEKIGSLFIFTAISAVVGSRLLFVITNLDQMGSFWQIFMINQGGLVAYGGFLGGFFSSLWYCRRHNISLLMWADAGVPSLAVGLGFTRIGCFLYGCDYGRISWDFGWAVQFPYGAPAWTHHFSTALAQPLAADAGVPALWGLEEWVAVAPYSHPVHPTQLYSSLNGWICFGFLMLVRRYYRRFTGQIFLLFFVYYGVTRFALEYVRDDLQRGYVGPVTTSQFIAVVSLLAALAGYYYLHRKAVADPAAARPWEHQAGDAPTGGGSAAPDRAGAKGKTGSKAGKAGQARKRSKGKGAGRKRKGRKRRSK